MKILLKALLWSIGFEVVLLVPILIANHARLGVFDAVFGVLAYLALFCHAPALFLLAHWPRAQETLIIPVLVQWCIWFIALVTIFTLSRIVQKRRLEHETHTASYDGSSVKH
jgi:hypothetical protein